MEVWALEAYGASYTPVSYTHLDVYKRQLLGEEDEEMKEAIRNLKGK